MEHVFSNINDESILIRTDFLEIEPFNMHPLGGVFVDILFRAGLTDSRCFGIEYKRGQCVVPLNYYSQDLLRPIKKAGYIDYKKVTRNKKDYLLITVTDFDYVKEDNSDGAMDQPT